ncbi:MAG: ThiF family adenylyltransferase [Burkholderiales bacterium]|nr:ThiF family adenylyltransferase [Burkholderiales bacterium]
MIKIKPTITYHFIEDYIYFIIAGKAQKIHDPDKFIYSLCNLLDGKRDFHNLEIELKNTHPTKAVYLNDILSTLDNAYILEDTALLGSNDNLSEYDKDRWSRNTEFFASYCKINDDKHDHQARLKQVRVTLLGIGGLGSHILYDLAALGVYNIRAVDFDKIELSNLNRQILYSESDFGRNKTDAAKDRMKTFFPTNNFEFINKKLSSSADVEEVIKGSDIVICVADKPRLDIQKWLNEACVKNKIPFITGGLDVTRAVLCTVIPRNTGCIECWKKAVENGDKTTLNLLQGENQFPQFEMPMPALVPLVSTLTGLMISEFTKLVTGVSKPQSLGKLLAFSFDDLSITEAESWTRQTDCTVCM